MTKRGQKWIQDPKIIDGIVHLKAPKSGSAITLTQGTGCKGACANYPRRLRNSQGEDQYENHAYCRRCAVYFLKELLVATKSGAKILCPCCHTMARRTPSSSARNRTKRRREAKLNG